MLTTSIFTSVTFQGYPFLKLSVGQNKDLHTGYGCHIIPHCVNSIDLAKSLRAPARSLGRPCRPKPFQGLRTSEGFAKCKTLRKASGRYQRLLWSNGFFVCSIGEASPETIRQYILSQGQLHPLSLTSHRAYRHQWVLRSDL